MFIHFHPGNVLQDFDNFTLDFSLLVKMIEKNVHYNKNKYPAYSKSKYIIYKGIRVIYSSGKTL